jgi:hypothetical protein
VFARSLPDHAVLDRVLRGRSWIPLLGVMLAGIVAMQVEVLKYGASMGRSIQRGTALASKNEQLRASVASLADQQRIESLATGMGMVMPAPTGVSFLAPQAANAERAIANIHVPNGTAFLAQLAQNNASNAAAVAPARPVGVTASIGTTGTGTAGTGTGATGTTAIGTVGTTGTGTTGTAGTTGTGTGTTGIGTTGTTGTGAAGTTAAAAATGAAATTATQSTTSGTTSGTTAGQGTTSGGASLATTSTTSSPTGP